MDTRSYPFHGIIFLKCKPSYHKEASMSSLDPNNWAGQVVALVLAALFGLGAVIGYYQLTYAHYSSKGKLVKLAVLEFAVLVPVGGQTALLGQPDNCPCSVAEYQEAMSRAGMVVFLTALGLVVAAIVTRPAMRPLPKSWMWKWLLHAYGRGCCVRFDRNG